LNFEVSNYFACHFFEQNCFKGLHSQNAMFAGQNCLTSFLRATLDKGPWTKSPGTDLNQIEPLIGPFFHICKKTLFPKVHWVFPKARGPIRGSNIKNVWLTCVRG
jgi:hypothetical protein